MAIYNMKNQKELENKENKQEPIIKKTPIKEDTKVLSEKEFQIQLESAMNMNTLAKPLDESISLINKYKESNNILGLYEEVSKLSKIKTNSIYEDSVISKTIRDAKPKFDCNINSIFDYVNDLPYFLPEEMEDMDITIDSNGLDLGNDVSLKEWYNKYKATCLLGSVNEYSSLWVNKLKELYSDYDKILECGNDDKIEQRRLDILKLGWNPELPFTIKTRQMVTERTRNKLKARCNDCCIDISESFKDISDNDIVLEGKSSYREPLFVALSYSGYAFSNIIRAYTHSKYSHAALGLSSDLKQLYSFNLNDGSRGFSIEGIDSYKKINDKSEIAVFVTFIPKYKFQQVKAKINDFVKNIDKTSYSVLNILGLAAGVNIEREKSMICSQFVDTILKSININVTDKPSGIVTPADIYNNAGKLMYKVYDGPVTKYSKAKVDNMIHKIENSLSIHEAVFMNVKSTPITFDEDGNLLIKNMKKLDYEAEYSKCHKLLVSYEKTNNIEGMKYELCKLWFMNTLLEKKIYNNKKDDKTKYHKARAKILNDFNYYLKYVCKHDKDFNFTEYYNNTPFSDAATKIDKHTLKYGVRLIKSILI